VGSRSDGYGENFAWKWFKCGPPPFFSRNGFGSTLQYPCQQSFSFVPTGTWRQSLGSENHWLRKPKANQIELCRKNSWVLWKFWKVFTCLSHRNYRKRLWPISQWSPNPFEPKAPPKPKPWAEIFAIAGKAVSLGVFWIQRIVLHMKVVAVGFFDNTSPRIHTGSNGGNAKGSESYLCIFKNLKCLNVSIPRILDRPTMKLIGSDGKSSL